MINAVEISPATAAIASRNPLVMLVAETLDELATYATHLSGSPQKAMEHVAAGLQQARRFPAAAWQQSGRPLLYRSVTRACRRDITFPPRPRGLRGLIRSRRQVFRVMADSAAAGRMTTAKRALSALPFEERAALLLRDHVQLSYAEIAQATEASPQSVARTLAAARRHFSAVYREITL